jgi:hypothetical protein
VPLDPHEYYRVRLTTGIKDVEDSIPLQTEYAWEFGQHWQKLYLPLVMRNS